MKEEKPVMRSIEEHNQERADWWASKKPYKGERVFVKCPKCPGQLLRKNPMPLLNEYPPKQIVHCSKCSFTTRINL